MSHNLCFSHFWTEKYIFIYVNNVYNNFSVELGVASALINLNWLLPGRMTLLIRPLMDCIKCVNPCLGKTQTNSAHDSSNNRSTTDLMPNGNSLQLQQLASSCLARLLLLEWQAVVHRTETPPTTNFSKAAAKVIKNLITSLTESEPGKKNMKIGSWIFLSISFCVKN